jgi:hypothetical protein
LRSRRVMFLLAWQPVFKTIQLNGQPSRGAIEVKKLPTERMLASEFESREPAGSQRLPELRLFECLLAPQPPGVAGPTHGVERRRPLRKDKSWPGVRTSHRGNWIKGPPLPGPLLQRRRGESLAHCSLLPNAPSNARAERWIGQAGTGGLSWPEFSTVRSEYVSMRCPPAACCLEARRPP